MVLGIFASRFCDPWFLALVLGEGIAKVQPIGECRTAVMAAEILHPHALIRYLRRLHVP